MEVACHASSMRQPVQGFPGELFLVGPSLDFWLGLSLTGSGVVSGALVLMKFVTFDLSILNQGAT